ncbi:MAG: cell division protein FtsL [Moritella sp.]|nr:cell division protein FtsL [Moritella sp.]EDM66323.1 cell division protein [Moritella sp. PE36]MBL1417342.1 cell division protein FtsL [Moritella sp.]PHR88151.1 MAG: cell division protein FtsL [Moritella sp.]
MFGIKWDLGKVIMTDIGQHRGVVSLLLAILIAAFAVIMLTHETRQLTNNKEQLLTQRDFADIEWRNLLLEQSTLEEHSKIEYTAKHKLGMYRPSTAEEQLVIQQ